MPRLSRILALIALALLPLLAGCETLGLARGLLRLQSGLTRAFPGGRVYARLDNSNLGLIFSNLPGSGSEAQQRALARRVAEYVRDRFDGYEDLSAIEVSFGTTASASAPNTTHVGHVYTFTPGELGAPSPAAPAEPPGAAPAGR